MLYSSITQTGGLGEMLTQQEWDEVHKRLVKPFPESEIKTYDAGKGGKMRYIDARMVQERLDDVVGSNNWSDTYMVIDSEQKAVECTLTIHGVSKSDVGYPNAGKDASDGNKEPLKAAYSDAFKRAAVRWGVGRHLYGPVKRTDPVLVSKVKSTLAPGSEKREAVRQYIIDNYGMLNSMEELSRVPEEVLTGCLNV
jgi:hypothetical protein